MCINGQAVAVRKVGVAMRYSQRLLGIVSCS